LSGALHLVVFEQPELQVIFSNLVINEKKPICSWPIGFFLRRKEFVFLPYEVCKSLAKHGGRET
jgi:hypothetical protein